MPAISFPEWPLLGLQIHSTLVKLVPCAGSISILYLYTSMSVCSSVCLSTYLRTYRKIGTETETQRER